MAHGQPPDRSCSVRQPPARTAPRFFEHLRRSQPFEQNKGCTLRKILAQHGRSIYHSLTEFCRNHAMRLLDRYLNAVRSFLPKKL